MADEAHKLYRFALYGRRGSGKSCFLAAMAIIGQDIGRATCTRLPLQVPEPTPEDDSPAARVARGLYLGKEWLDAASESLKAGQVPEPTPLHYFSDSPMTLDYEISDDHRGSSTIRLIDYSGELINPSEEHDPESGARKLRKFLAESDGFLVFAEVPRNNNSATTELAPELERLRQAFISLQKHEAVAISTPVCVVLTKWDRQSEIDYDNPEHERQKVQEFLERFPQYQTLLTAISNALTAQAKLEQSFSLLDQTQGSLDPPAVASAPSEVLEDSASATVEQTEPLPVEDAAKESLGLEWGNVCVFPASAFGAAQIQDGQELPVAGAIKPFGLLVPFLWLANRRDALDAADLESGWKKLGWRWWFLSLLARFMPANRVWKRSLDWAINRVPPHSEPGRTLTNLRWRMRIASIASFLIWVAFFSVAGWLEFSGSRAYQFHSWQQVVDNPQSTLEDLSNARNFFEKYVLSESFLNGPLAPSREAAQAEMHRIDRRVEEQLWGLVRAENDLCVQALRAKEYLDKYPNGPHAGEAGKLIDHCERQNGIEQNARWLEKVAWQLNNAGSIGQVDAVLRMIEEGFPALYQTEEQKTQLTELRRQAENRKVVLEWHDFLQRYQEAIKEEQWQRAVKLLTGWPRRDEQWQNLIRAFPEQMETILKQTLQELLKENNFRSARERLNEASGALQTLESSLRSKEPTLAETILQAQQKITSPQQAEIDRREDIFLYQKVQRNKDLSSCKDYLENAPLQEMQSAVKSYQDFLNKRDGEIEVEVSLKIRWDKDYYGDSFIKGETGENFITFTVDDKHVWKSGSIPEARGELSGELYSFTLKGKRTDPHKISVSIIEVDSTDADDDAGSGEKSVTLDDLRRGVEIPLRPAGGGFENVAVLRIETGWPHEPELPKHSKEK